MSGDARKLDPHRRGSWIADALLGGQDGLVNVLGVVLGIAVASHERRLVLVAGLAAALGESVSMAAVAYTSRVAQGELYRGERAREFRHIAVRPDLERREIRDLFGRMGFDGELLDRVVEKVTSDADVWVGVMMALEHQLTDVDRRRSLRSSAIVGATSLVGSFIPLAPFLVLPIRAASWTSVALASCVLFLFGVYKARMTVGDPIKNGIGLALIGTASALVGYGVGLVFQIAP